MVAFSRRTFPRRVWANSIRWLRTPTRTALIIRWAARLTGACRLSSKNPPLRCRNRRSAPFTFSGRQFFALRLGHFAQFFSTHRFVHPARCASQGRLRSPPALGRERRSSRHLLFLRFRGHNKNISQLERKTDLPAAP